jgi:hypothetical protein
MYDQTGALVENMIDRYAIGDRTRGLVTDPDGALTILLQHERPGDPSANWLPAPAGSSTSSYASTYHGPRRSTPIERLDPSRS